MKHHDTFVVPYLIMATKVLTYVLITCLKPKGTTDQAPFLVEGVRRFRPFGRLDIPRAGGPFTALVNALCNSAPGVVALKFTHSRCERHRKINPASKRHSLIQDPQP